MIRNDAHLAPSPATDVPGRVDSGEVSADPVLLAAGAWQRAWADTIGVRLPPSPQRGQILHMEMRGLNTGAWRSLVRLRAYYLLGFSPDRVVFGGTRDSDTGFDPRPTVGVQRDRQVTESPRTWHRSARVLRLRFVAIGYATVLGYTNAPGVTIGCTAAIAWSTLTLTAHTVRAAYPATPPRYHTTGLTPIHAPTDTLAARLPISGGVLVLVMMLPSRSRRWMRRCVVLAGSVIGLRRGCSGQAFDSPQAS